jgi:NAD(P)-dependent dehydrogenase (short-subunit alcohol dehydrogenase family)
MSPVRRSTASRDGHRARRDGLRDRVVVITGAARGIGALLAGKVAARGGVPVLIGLEPGPLSEVARRVGGHWWEVDVTDAGALATTAATISATLGRIDMVVANAGAASGGTLMLADPRAYERTLEVNLFGSIRTARAFLPALIESKGHYLQIASVAALVPVPMMGAYCASKAGVEAFAHCLAGELQAHDVTAGVAYLSWTDTDMVRGAEALRGLGELRQGMRGPLGKTYPLEPVVERIVEGLARRSLHVYGQGWLVVLPPLRGVLPGLMLRLGRSEIRRLVLGAEARIREVGPEATALVGPGGAAAAAGSGGAGAVSGGAGAVSGGAGAGDRGVGAPPPG